MLLLWDGWGLLWYCLCREREKGEHGHVIYVDYCCVDLRMFCSWVWVDEYLDSSLRVIMSDFGLR